MRIAVLVVGDHTGSEQTQESSAHEIFGKSVLLHQIDFAQRLGCNTVLLFGASRDRVTSVKDQLAADGSLSIRALGTAGALADAVDPDDQTLVMQATVLPDFQQAVAEPATWCEILAFQTSTAESADYERIDGSRSWSGVAFMPGRVVQSLADLPDDVEVASVLLRLALQHGCAVRMLDPALITEKRWSVRESREELAARSQKLIDTVCPRTTSRAPGTGFSEHLGARLARDLVGRPGERSFPAIGWLTLVSAVAMAWLGREAIGIALLIAAAVSFRVGQTIDRIANAVSSRANLVDEDRFTKPMLDLAVICVLTSAGGLTLQLTSVFAPVMLVGLLHLGERHANKAWQPLYADRVTLLAVLFIAAVIGQVQSMVMLISLGLMITRFIPAFRSD